MRHGKNYRSSAERIASRAKETLALKDAVSLVKNSAKAKFDETVEIASHLGVDPRHSDQLVRGTVVLPHGTGKSIRVLVFTKGEKEKEAQAAGADFVGADEYAKKIQEGWTDVDAILDLAGLELLDRLRDVEGDGAALRVRHQAAGTQDAAELRELAHPVDGDAASDPLAGDVPQAVRLGAHLRPDAAVAG